MARTSRRLSIGAVALLVLGAVLFLVALRAKAGFHALREVWSAAEASPPGRFHIVAFPVGIEERGVPDRAILLTLDDWLNPIGVVRWRRNDEDVAVQRRLLRVDLEPTPAAALIEGLNRAASAHADSAHQGVEFEDGDRVDERRLTVVGRDGSREVFVYGVSFDGAVEARRILKDGDRVALVGSGLWAMGGVLLVWVAALLALGGAIVGMREKKRAQAAASTSPPGSPSAGPAGVHGPR